MRKSVLGNDPLAKRATSAPEPAKNPSPPKARSRKAAAPPKASAVAQAVAHQDSPVLVEATLPTKTTLPATDTSASHPASGGRLSRFVRQLAGIDGASTLDEFGHDAALARWADPLWTMLSTVYWRLEVENPSVVPEQPCVFVCNHGGAIPIDGPLLADAVRRERPMAAPVRWLLEDEVFNAPLLGRLFNRLGAVRASRENALALLSRGFSVAVFPEGAAALNQEAGLRDRLGPFGRGGYLRIAHEVGARVIPVAIVGSKETMPLLGRLPFPWKASSSFPITLPPLPKKWRVHLEEPIDVREALGRDLSVEAVGKLNERVKATIQAALDILRAVN